MTSSTRRLGALLVVLALGAACGSDDNNNSDRAQGGKVEDAAPNKSEFIASADEICKAGNAQSDELFGAIFGGGEPEPAAVQENLNKILDIGETLMADVRALTPPKGDEAEIKALWDENEAVMTAVRAQVATPDGAMGFISNEDDPFAAVNEKLAAYGFADCAGEGEQATSTFGGDELSADELATAPKVEVRAVDFKYEGVAASYAAGPTVFSFTNGGTTDHEFGLVKLAAGVSADDAIAKVQADPEDESYIERFVGAAYAKAGEGTPLNVKLDRGLYAFACFVENDEGVPHVQVGMFGTFNVAG